jgi:acyl-CoA thioesterase
MIETFAHNDKFAAYIGIELIEARPGFAKAKLELSESHMNSVGTIHGGAIFTLADFVFAVASNSHGRVAVAINASISYFKAISSGVIVAESREISLGDKLSSYTIEIRDKENDLVALFQGMTYRKKETHPFTA